jgi:SAM-dependent methyltransferase
MLEAGSTSQTTTPQAGKAARMADIAGIFAAAAAAAAAGDAKRFRAALWENTSRLWEYLRGWNVDGASPELAASYVDDAWNRFLHTLGLVPLPPPARLLEIGSNPYYFHLLLRKLFPRAEVQGVNFFEHDIFSTRQSEIVQATRHAETGEVLEFSSRLFNLETTARYPYPESSFDLVFFCETLEHLVVNPLPTFRKLKRLLSPGGHLVITLPNAVRLANFALMLHGHNFFDLYQAQNGVHGRHNREYTLEEMKVLLTKSGLEVIRAETHDRYDYDRGTITTMDYTGRSIALPEKRRDLLALLKRSGGDPENRGDNLYLLARKPTASAARVLREPPPDAPADGAVTAPLDGASDQLVVSLDRCDDSPGSLSVSGWAFRRDGDRARQSVHLILDAPAGAYTFRAAPVWREDAADANGLEFDDPGFRLELDKSRLRPGLYRLGLLVHSAGARPLFQRLPGEIAVDG